jgi:Tfp pilus assembly protein PilF
MRLGLGICLFQMGQFDRARAAYERVLQLDPANCDALLGLAVLELNSAPSGKANDASSDQTCASPLLHKVLYATDRVWLGWITLVVGTSGPVCSGLQL